MALSDFFGGFLGWGSNAYAETTDQSIDRANVRFVLPTDSRLYLRRWTRRELNSKAEWVYQNFGIAKELVGGIARHVIGKGVSLQIDAEEDDPNQIELAEQDFETYAMTPERCDLAGRRDFYETQTTAIEQRLIRGEFFCQLAENPQWNNEPCFLVRDSEEISTPRDQMENARLIDGVELDDQTRATAYWVKSSYDASTRVDRSRMIHWMKPHAVNQIRGVTDFAQGVNPLVDVHELERLATRDAKAKMIVALMLKGVKKSRRKGAIGAIDSAGRNADGTPDADSAQIERLLGGGGGGIVYVDDPAGDVKLISSDSPSPLVEPFITDLLLRNVCLSLGVPPEFFWNIAKLTGSNTRFVLSRADLFFQIMGDRLVSRFCTPVAFRYLSHRIQTGKLPAFRDPNWGMKLSWQMPPRVTVDNERENRILIELLANGLMTMREFCNARGMNYKATMRQWIREPLQFIQMAEDEGADEIYVQRLRDNLPLWRPPLPGTVTQKSGDGSGDIQPPGDRTTSDTAAHNGSAP